MNVMAKKLTISVFFDIFAIQLLDTTKAGSRVYWMILLQVVGSFPRTNSSPRTPFKLEVNFPVFIFC
jgi:hypothetical protein